MFFTGRSSAGSSSNGCEDYLVIIIIIIVVIDGHSFGRSVHSLNVFSQVLECPVQSIQQKVVIMELTQFSMGSLDGRSMR